MARPDPCCKSAASGRAGSRAANSIMLLYSLAKNVRGRYTRGHNEQLSINLALIITSPLAAAIAELLKNAELPRSVIAREHPELIGTFRTAAIKSFEYAYELGIRLIRRRLESMAATPAEIEQMEFKTLMRTAGEKGLIDDPVAWLLFREKRNITSHTYDETKSLDVLGVIPQFIGRAQFLLERLNSPRDASG